MKLRGDQRNICLTFRGAACVFLASVICIDFKYFVSFLIHVFGSGSKLGDVEGCSLGGGVGAGLFSCTLGC